MPARRRRRRRVADRRRRRARPVGGRRRDHVPARRCGCSPPTTATETLLLVSKPPAPRGRRSARRRRRRRQARGRRVRRLGRRRRAVRGPPDARGRRVRRRGRRAAGRRRRSSVPRADGDAARPVLRRLARPRGARRSSGARATAILDLGEEEYTQGRPHPMVDLERPPRDAARRGADDVGCVLLDVVLGHGVARRSGRRARRRRSAELADGRPVIAHVCGTADDPQDARRQEATLRDAGVIVAPTNAAAARLAAEGGRREDRDAHLLGEAARRRRARARGLRGARAARPRRRAVGARARPARSCSAPTARAAAARPPRAGRRAVRRAHPGHARGLRRGPARRCWRGGFDVVHAQDCLSANAALALRDQRRDRPRDPHRAPRRRLHVAVAGRVPGPLDPRARPRAVRLAAVGRAPGATTSACDAGLVRNGVDTRRFRPPRDAAERARARRRAGLGDRFAVLTVGGDRAAQGLAHAARGLRARCARACPSATRCC